VSRQSCGYSITSSASNCTELGTSRPSALAVCQLMTNSDHGRGTWPVRAGPRFERELSCLSLPVHRPATGELLNHPVRSAGCP
jgi:hypothetical protein